MDAAELTLNGYYALCCITHMSFGAHHIRGVAKLQTPNVEKGEAIGGRGWYHSKEHW